MSATNGILTAFLIFLKAAAHSLSGTETRTISAPAACNASIWPIVACTSAVLVLVID